MPEYCLPCDHCVNGVCQLPHVNAVADQQIVILCVRAGWRRATVRHAARRYKRTGEWAEWLDLQ